MSERARTIDTLLDERRTFRSEPGVPLEGEGHRPEACSRPRPPIPRALG